MESLVDAERVLNLRVTHKRATVPTLEAVRFEHPSSAMKEMAGLPTVSECVLLQTCNRVEVFALATESVSSAKADIRKLWFSEERRRKAGEEVLEASAGSGAIGHAL